jgi:alcohol dehydrogenase class IV
MLKLPTISYLTQIYFEPDAQNLLPTLLEKLSTEKPLIVTDKGLIASGLIDKLCEVGVIFDDVEPNPTEANVLDGLNLMRKNGCDGIVAIGGGSPIDCAKCIALMARHPGSMEDYAFLKDGLPKITANKPPVIAMPTTAGTGSEVGRAALITLKSGQKTAFLSPYFIPDAVICDPHLTLHMPAALTAGTGMDAISHCVETFCSPTFNPVADAIALDGLQRAYANIREVCHNGLNLEARSEMMMSALQGGLTFQKGLGAIHSLSHPLGGLTEKRLHHGTLNAIFLPHVLRFNLESCPGKMDKIAQAIGTTSRHDVPKAFEKLILEIGLPLRLRDMQITKSDLEPMAERALRDHCSRTNPRQVTLEDYRIFYEDAF